MSEVPLWSFRGAVFKAHRRSYHSTLDLRVIKKKTRDESPPTYRGTSLIRNSPLLGPYRRTVSRALWWP